MPARNITINGVSNSFEWQVGNTTRFIRFEDITNYNYASAIVACGSTLNALPPEEMDRFEFEYKEWRKQR
ncbi:hypothetical protein [Lapidilactobacillus dextrinicus]|uniref:hypothetical protein n=1 Tax=Lapidilactobacillus dextrinicus TaxID=51664 RepID=UPI003F26DED9